MSDGFWHPGNVDLELGGVTGCSCLVVSCKSEPPWFTFTIEALTDEQAEDDGEADRIARGLAWWRGAA